MTEKHSTGTLRRSLNVPCDSDMQLCCLLERKLLLEQAPHGKRFHSRVHVTHESEQIG